jgi:hypothetical protein
MAGMAIYYGGQDTLVQTGYISIFTSRVPCSALYNAFFLPFPALFALDK